VGRKHYSIAIIVLCVASSSGICCNTTKISSLALQHTLTFNTEINLKYFVHICKICLQSRKTTVLLIIGCLYDVRLKDVPVFLGRDIHSYFLNNNSCKVYVRFCYFGDEHEGCFILGYYAVWFVSLVPIFGEICSVEEHESTMKLEAVDFFETLVCIYRFSQHHILEDTNFCLLFSPEYSPVIFQICH
jgi:hypothetical protein